MIPATRPPTLTMPGTARARRAGSRSFRDRPGAGHRGAPASASNSESESARPPGRAPAARARHAAAVTVTVPGPAGGRPGPAVGPPGPASAAGRAAATVTAPSPLAGPVRAVTHGASDSDGGRGGPSRPDCRTGAGPRTDYP
jgi:hypothetical protein